MDFELVGPIRNIQPIAVGRAIRGLVRLRKRYGSGRWRKLKGIAKVRLMDGMIHTAEIHWYEAHGLAKRTEDKVSFAGLIMKKRVKQAVCFAVCINNKSYEASLEAGKLYRVIPDEEAESHGYLRVVDESGEDYGYSADRFFRLEVPRPLERALLRVSS